jgi:hypothetical protein
MSNVPTTLTPLNSSLTGEVSWFGGPHDPTSGPTTASGAPVTQPGIAIYNEATLGGWWRVKFPNGKTADLQQTDIGPAPWTGRKVDVTYSALGSVGYTETDFPTNSTVTATYLGRVRPSSSTTSTTPAAGASGGGATTPPATSTGGSGGGSSSWFDTLIKWATYFAFIAGGATLIWYGTKTALQPPRGPS